jgi:hypothetical protein
MPESPLTPLPVPGHIIDAAHEAAEAADPNFDRPAHLVGAILMAVNDLYAAHGMRAIVEMCIDPTSMKAGVLDALEVRKLTATSLDVLLAVIAAMLSHAADQRDPHPTRVHNCEHCKDHRHD